MTEREVNIKNVYQSLKNIEKGLDYEVITTWRGIPVKVKLKVKWVSLPDRFVSFDFFGCKFERAFSEEKVYIKLHEVYIECNVFSTAKDELILLANSISPPPPVMIRKFLRVEPSENNPVLASICLARECVVSVRAIDISEGGIGVLLKKEETEKFFSIIPNIEEYRGNFSLVVELPREEPIEALGELRNIALNKEEGTCRLGFKLSLKEQKLTKIRKYILHRQREILDELKSL